MKSVLNLIQKDCCLFLVYKIKTETTQVIQLSNRNGVVDRMTGDFQSEKDTKNLLFFVLGTIRST